MLKLSSLVLEYEGFIGAAQHPSWGGPHWLEPMAAPSKRKDLLTGARLPSNAVSCGAHTAAAACTALDRWCRCALTVKWLGFDDWTYTSSSDTVTAPLLASNTMSSEGAARSGC